MKKLIGGGTEFLNCLFCIIQALLIYAALYCMINSNAIGSAFNAHPLYTYDLYSFLFSRSIYGWLIFCIVWFICQKFRSRPYYLPDMISACLLSLLLWAGQFIAELGSFGESVGTVRGFILFTIGFLGSTLAIRILFLILRDVKQYIMNHAVHLPALITDHLFLIIWITLSLCWLPFAIIRYPGGTEWDAYHQIEQFLYGGMNAHWPPASSALMGSFVKFGKDVFNSYDVGLFLFTLALMIFTAAVFSYSVRMLQKLHVPDFILVIITLLYIFVPVFPTMATSAVKDAPFAAVVLLFIIFTADAVFELKHKNPVLHYVLFGLTAVAMCLLRNNGIYIVYFCIAFLIIYWCIRKNKKYQAMLIALIATAVINAGYNKILLPALNIQPTSVAEALSLPFQQTARYLKEYPDDISKKEYKAVDEVLDVKTVGEVYQPGLSDYVKGTYRGDSSKLGDYFKAWATMGIRHPGVYIDAALNTTTGFYYPDAVLESGEQIWLYWDTESDDQLQFKEFHCFDKQKEYLYKYVYELMRFPLTYPLANTAVGTWITISLCIYSLCRKRKVFLSVIPSLVGVLVCFASPTFVHNGARYALPVIYSSLFLMALCIFADRKEAA